MIRLSKKWQTLAWLPEAGMGYQIATVVLKDGRRFEQVVILEGSISHVRGMKDIPFQEDDIEDIVLTNARWDWKKEEW